MRYLLPWIAAFWGVLLLAPEPGLGHPRSAQEERDQAGPPGGEFKRVPGLGLARRTATDGTLEVRLRDGRIIRTHGSDVADVGGDTYPPYERQPACVSQLGVPTDQYANIGVRPGRTVLVYVRPADVANNSAIYIPMMRSVFRRMNWFTNQKVYSSGEGDGNVPFQVDLNTICSGSTIFVAQYTASFLGAGRRNGRGRLQ